MLRIDWLPLITALSFFNVAAQTDLPDVRIRGEKPLRPERPDKPDRRGKSAEMKEIVRDFRAKLTELHAECQDLKKQLKDATEEERAKLREELVANRETVNTLKEQFRDDVRELHESLKNHGGKVDDEAKAEAKATTNSGRSRE